MCVCVCEREREIFGCVIFILFMLICKRKSSQPTANYIPTVELGGSQNSVVGIATSYRLGGLGFES